MTGGDSWAARSVRSWPKNARNMRREMYKADRNAPANPTSQASR